MSNGQRKMARPEHANREPGPYAVLCPEHGRVFLTEDEYGLQLMMPDALWVCPLDGQAARWDDDNFESYLPADDLTP